LEYWWRKWVVEDRMVPLLEVEEMLHTLAVVGVEVVLIMIVL
jgi:hypothetical protein